MPSLRPPPFRPRLGAIVGLAAAFATASPGLGQESGSRRGVATPCAETASEDIVAAADESGITLRSGKRVRIVDVRLTEDAGAGGKLRSWLGSLAESPVIVGEVGPADRWGRIPATVSLAGRAPIAIGELLVGEGWAVVDAGPRDALCGPGLLVVEAASRARKRGLWAGSPWPLPAGDAARLAAAAGHFALVEGRVLSVGERRERTYLNFGRDWSRDFNVTIPRRTWAALKARGMSVETLRGRIVRVRGLVELRKAPTLDIVAPDMLEIVDAPAGSRTQPDRE